MRLLQRTSALVGWAVIVALGVLLVLEAAGVVGDDWRSEIASIMQAVKEPRVEQWAAALIGLSLAVLAALVVAAQLTSRRRSAKFRVIVHESDNGRTVLTSGALQSAIRSALQEVGEVKEVSAVATRRRVDARIVLVDGVDVLAAASECDSKLGDEFWSDLGVTPSRVDLRFEFQHGARHSLL